jgi:autotransporter-associated beta strand protein
VPLQNNASSPAAIALTVGGNNASTYYTGGLSGSGSLTKTGSGTLNLFGANTYAGTTTVSSGTLRLGAGIQTIGTASLATSGSNLPNTNFSPASNNLLYGLSPTVNTNTLAGQTGNGNVPTGPVTVLTDGKESSTGVETTDLPNVYTIGNNASLTYVLGSAANGYGLTQINVYSEWNDGGRSQITLNDIDYSTVANPTVFSAIPDGAINYTSGDAENKASITASGGLLASGVYALRFDFGSQENGWVGYAELEAVGTPIVGNNSLPATTALTVNATLDLNGGNQQVASLTGSGNIINSYAGTNATLTLAPASSSTTFGGIIQNNGGTGGTVRLTLNSSGSGTQILTGLNTYTGGTTVTQGTLQVSSTGALGPGNLTIASAGTVALQNAAQTVAALSNAGTLSLTGNLTVTGGLTLATGSNTSFALGTPNGTGGTALIAVNGSITNSGSSTNEVTFGWSATPQTGTYDLFSYTGSTTTSAFYLNPTSIANYTNLSETLSTGLSGQVDLIVTVLPVAWSGLQGGPNTPLGHGHAELGQ